MKIFGLYTLLLLVSMFMVFSVWKNASIEEMMKGIMATQIAYIMYRLITEEDKS